jgi:hypothetical protein
MTANCGYISGLGRTRPRPGDEVTEFLPLLKWNG